MVDRVEYGLRWFNLVDSVDEVEKLIKLIKLKTWLFELKVVYTMQQTK